MKISLSYYNVVVFTYSTTNKKFVSDGTRH